jgi:GTP pyrophosphokinase
MVSAGVKTYGSATGIAAGGSGMGVLPGNSFFYGRLAGALRFSMKIVIDQRTIMLMTDEKRQILANMITAPYVSLATMLISKARKSSGNQFRHQVETRAILIDYGHISPVLHKAALTHDILEDLEDFDVNLLKTADADGPAVYELVMEVTRQKGEKKSDFLRRIYDRGSLNAKLIKCADRISNMTALGLGLNTERDFIQRYCTETEEYVLPIARMVDRDMWTELTDLISSRRKLLSFVP